MAVLVPAVSGMSTKQVDLFAQSFLRVLSPHCLQDPQKLDCIEIWERLGDDDSPYAGLSPKVEDLPQGVEGRTWPDGRIVLATATYNAALEGKGRARFTIMHELMHAIHHMPQIRRMRGSLQNEKGLRLNRRGELKPYLDPEWQADVFASASLMPAAMVTRAVGGLRRTAAIVRVSDVFGVSLEAAQYRLEAIDRYSLC